MRSVIKVSDHFGRWHKMAGQSASPLLALSGLSEVSTYVSAFGGEADMLGRVALIAAVVDDPKRTWQCTD